MGGYLGGRLTSHDTTFNYFGNNYNVPQDSRDPSASGTVLPHKMNFHLFQLLLTKKQSQKNISKLHVYIPK